MMELQRYYAYGLIVVKVLFTLLTVETLEDVQDFDLGIVKI